jgi:hypothetical protein
LRTIKIFSTAAVFVVVYFLLIYLVWGSIFVAPKLLRFAQVPFHEMSHLAAIKAVEIISGKEIRIEEVVFLNIDFGSFERMYYSFMLSFLGIRPLGYVSLCDKEVEKLTWEEQFWIGLAGGAGGLIFILFFWFVFYKIYYKIFERTNITILFSVIIIHLPFFITSVDIVLYACEEAGKLGFV